MVTLAIQIPCYNEADQLGKTLADLPVRIDGVNEIIVVVVDDGSTDSTVQVAKQFGVHFVVRHRRNRGLSAAFSTGVDACLSLGANVIVNTDADGQYPGCYIERLLEPILSGRADIVIGDRRPGRDPNLSMCKRLLQRLGSRVVSLLSGQPIPDAVSGFRAMTRDAAIKICLQTRFSHTVETLLQAAHLRLAIENVPICAMKTERASRLAASIHVFVFRQMQTMFRMALMYRPNLLFGPPAVALLLLGLLPLVRFLILWVMGHGEGHLQSLVIGGTLALAGVGLGGLAVIVGLIAFNRRMLEKTLLEVREQKYALNFRQPGLLLDELSKSDRRDLNPSDSSSVEEALLT